MEIATFVGKTVQQEPRIWKELHILILADQSKAELKAEKRRDR